MSIYTGPERRDLSDKGILRRLEEKTIWNCLKCWPRLCRCEDRKVHGTHMNKGSIWETHTNG